MGERGFFVVVLVAIASAGCSDSGESSDPLAGPPEGYTRYRTEPITVAPGESGLWAQWISAPIDRDLDVVDVTGTQTTGGHHALMYSTTELHDIGFSRPWENVDQLTARFIGGIGGEGTGKVSLPPGVVFRIEAGTALVVQTHYINVTSEPIVGEAILDVKLAEVSPEAQVASMFANATTQTAVEPGASNAQVSCVLGSDIELLMFANHMHEAGSHVETREIKSDGTTVDVKIDPEWQYEWAFSPNFTHASPGSPWKLQAGSTLVTDCAWENSGAGVIEFPDEMCVFYGMRLGEGDITCVEGTWIE